MKAAEKIVTRSHIEAFIEHIKSSGSHIVFTNGCFDILHVGHARYLAQARELGDYLVVGLNSDVSVRGLKGDSRPVIPEDERAEMLAHLECVDCVCLFDELRPDNLIELVRPHIHAKGGDYTAEQLPEAEVVRRNGGRVEILSLFEGKSTTNIVEKIKNLCEFGS